MLHDLTFLSFTSCANDSSQWMPLPINSSDITVELQMAVDNHIESHIIFHHLENTVAVRCMARNDMGVVSREVKLVSNGKRPVLVSTETALNQSIHLKCSKSLSVTACHAFIG